MIQRRISSLLALLALPACGGSTPAPPPGDTCEIALPALSDHHLHADGTLLRDALGRVVALRGVNAGGHSKLPPYAPFEFASAADYDAALAAYLDRAASWGIDVLRVPFLWAAAEPTEGSLDEAYLQRYDALLDAAWARGMYTIVDFHQDIYADIFCGDGFPAWTVPDPHPAPHHDCPSWGSKYLGDSDVQAAFDRFWMDGSPIRAKYEKLWDTVATRYANKPGVIGFEPFNEPGWGTADLPTWEETTLTAFYSAMATRIHAVAPDALVFFDAPGTDAVTLSTALAKPSGDNLVFAPHYYQYGALSGSAPNTAGVRLDLQRWANKQSQWNLPVLVGEFGVSNQAPDGAAFLAAHFDAFDALALHGTAWEYSVTSELWNEEDLSLARADGTESASAAGVVRPFARAAAGSDVAFTYAADTRAVTLAYTPSPGVTEITLPARLYPNGADVSVAGGCADTSHLAASRLLVRASDGASAITVRVTPK
jgi:endoglycosylceramidase